MMLSIEKTLALEKLAKAVENSSADNLVEVHAELFPARPLPNVTSAAIEHLGRTLAQHVREGLEPEEMVDLWNVVFPTNRNVYFDDEDQTLRYNERN